MEEGILTREVNLKQQSESICPGVRLD